VVIRRASFVPPQAVTSLGSVSSSLMTSDEEAM
jgi:hypothetical protein